MQEAKLSVEQAKKGQHLGSKAYIIERLEAGGFGHSNSSVGVGREGGVLCPWQPLHDASPVVYPDEASKVFMDGMT